MRHIPHDRRGKRATARLFQVPGPDQHILRSQCVSAAAYCIYITLLTPYRRDKIIMLREEVVKSFVKKLSSSVKRCITMADIYRLLKNGEYKFSKSFLVAERTGRKCKTLSEIYFVLNS